MSGDESRRAASGKHGDQRAHDGREDDEDDQLGSLNRSPRSRRLRNVLRAVIGADDHTRVPDALSRGPFDDGDQDWQDQQGLALTTLLAESLP